MAEESSIKVFMPLPFEVFTCFKLCATLRVAESNSEVTVDTEGDKSAFNKKSSRNNYRKNKIKRADCSVDLSYPGKDNQLNRSSKALGTD